MKVTWTWVAPHRGVRLQAFVDDEVRELIERP